jgi:hypothetical protein
MKTFPKRVIHGQVLNKDKKGWKLPLKNHHSTPAIAGVDISTLPLSVGFYHKASYLARYLLWLFT